MTPMPRDSQHLAPVKDGRVPPSEREAAAALSVRGLTVAYGEAPAVFDADADFATGRRTAIIGPNGAGKSSLLKAALGLVPRVSGEIRFFGRTLEAVRQRVAYVPQRATVDWDFPARVQDVVAMGLYPELGLLRRLGADGRRRIVAALDQVGMAGFAERQIGQLSGGQAQRVFIARALVKHADLFILDEPFAGVDMATEALIMQVLADLAAAGKTVICVHHDLSTVAGAFDEVVLINRRVVAQGDVGTTLTSASLQSLYGGRLPEGLLRPRATTSKLHAR